MNESQFHWGKKSQCESQYKLQYNCMRIPKQIPSIGGGVTAVVDSELTGSSSCSSRNRNKKYHHHQQQQQHSSSTLVIINKNIIKAQIIENNDADDLIYMYQK